MTTENPYWPCLLVEHEAYNSIILSDFHYFDDYFGDKGGGGYSVERLAKKLAKENQLKEIKFDSEAGMFCAYSQDTNQLLELCRLLGQFIGNKEDYTAIENTKPLILEKAEELLIKGFVQDTDLVLQGEFYANVPYPALSKKQSEYLQAIKNGTDEEIIHAARRINSEARTKTRQWENYLSHPKTITMFIEALEKRPTDKVYQELIWALVFICDRHLPDLRTQPYFLNALKSKNAQIRLLGLWGLDKIYSYPTELVLAMKNDKSEKVRDYAMNMEDIRQKFNTFPVWMFTKEYKKI